MTTTSAAARPAPMATVMAALLSLAIAGACAAAYWYGQGSLETVRLIDRMMARTAVVLFCAAFAASALASLFPGRMTQWLLAHRRDLALAFAAAFALHLLAIAGFYRLDPKSFWSVSPPLLIALRAIGVAFVLLMLIDLRSLLGPGGRTTLNSIGGWYLWLAFLSGFGKRVGQDPVYLWLTTLLLLVPVLRLAAALRRRRAISPAASGSSR